MPVLTRSKRRLLSKDVDQTRTDDSSKKLVDITNKKQTKLTNKLQKINSKEVMSVSEQLTVEVPRGVAGKKRKASQSGNFLEIQQEEAIDIAKKSRSQQNESSGSSGSLLKAKSTSNDHSDYIEMMKKIKRMLERSFKNVAERLQLDPIPSCLYDLKKCHAAHHPKNAIKTISNTTKTTILDALSIDTRIWRFINSVRHNVLGLNQFPGSDVMSKILEKILVRTTNIFYLMNLNYFMFLEIESKHYRVQHKFYA